MAPRKCFASKSSHCAEAKRLSSAVIQADAQNSETNRQMHALRDELEALKAVTDLPDENSGAIDADLRT